MHAPTNLKCEYRVDPLGLDCPKPRFFWQSADPRPNARQTKYRIVVDGLWDSGEVTSDESIQIEYAGAPLKSRTRATWRVMTWDQNGVPSPWSADATFELALLDRAEWKGSWIASPIVGGPYTSPPTPLLRKAFTLSMPIASARLYITALGLYDAELNGQRVGDARLAPGRTEYAVRVPYHTYDVTSHLTQGDNAIGVTLGDGWFCGHLHSDPRQTYGDRPRLLAQLEVTFSDGTRQTIASDDTWRAGEGAIRSSDMLMGEDVDARMDQPDYAKPGFDDSGWRPIIVMNDTVSDTGTSDTGTQLVSAVAPMTRVTQTLRPVGPPTVSANKRRHLFDMGQNMVGHVRLRIRNAPPGQTIDLRYVEMLDANGKPYTTALRSARATDHYTTRGGAEEFFEPKFTFHGFRYIEVRDYPGRNPTVDDLVGVVLHSDCAPTGTFECSEPVINQLQSNITWSQRGNFIDIPTDCPQRDERLGWTGDAQVFIRTAAFNMDVANFFAKWLQDMADTQTLHGDGRIHSVVPGVKSIHHEGGPAWADAAIICPWTLYQCYGDTRVLRDRYHMMTWFLDWLERDTGPTRIRCDESRKWKGYGDWLNQDAFTPQDLIGTAFFAHSSDLMSRIAGVLGNDADASKYRVLFQDVRSAFRKRFVKPDGALTVDTQTAQVLALHFDLLEPAHRPIAIKTLVDDIAARGTHLSTGFVGTPYLTHVLSDAGRDDVAFALLMQKTFPGWLFPITHGATTMWERWDGWTPEKGFNDAGMNSYNHYAFGAVGAWMYQRIAGIDLAVNAPAYKHITFTPTPGGGLTHARATLDSLYGTIESGWKIDGGEMIVTVVVPANATADLCMPTRDGSPRKSEPLGPGRHERRIAWA